jgi:hypothetical protein
MIKSWGMYRGGCAVYGGPLKAEVSKVQVYLTESIKKRSHRHANETVFYRVPTDRLTRIPIKIYNWKIRYRFQKTIHSHRLINNKIKKCSPQIDEMVIE